MSDADGTEDSSAAGAEAIDRRADDMLRRAYLDGGIDVFDAAENTALEVGKKAAARLVQLRLAFYTDEARDRIQVTNSGRYWALNGGYMGFLKEDPPTGGGGRGRNPEMEALRFTYMKLRLNTFWFSFGMSIAGFVLSLVSIALALYFRDTLLR